MPLDCLSVPLSRDLYDIPIGARHIIYSPLRGLALLLNRDALQLLKSLLAGETAAPRNPTELTALNRLAALQLNDPDPPIPPHLQAKDFCPTSVKLFLTYNCNLRCRYCYSMGGDNPLDMPVEMARAAIDLVCENAVRTKRSEIFIRFHGAGEPTTNWAVLVDAVDYASKKASEHRLNGRFSLTSNCMFNRGQARWIADHMTHVNASMDGPEAIQNEQRPTVDEKGSFENVFRTLKCLEEFGVEYHIRCTVTDASVARLPESVRFFCRNLRPRSIHIEPVAYCGRCVSTGVQPPDPDRFIESYRLARAIGKGFKIALHYSGAQLNSLGCCFCGAAGHNFIVLPDGNVTTCFDVCRVSDPRAGYFFYGQYCAENRSFTFDQERLEVLRHISEIRRQSCESCFLQWHCAGECMAKSVINTNDILMPDPSRCRINQIVARERLEELLEAGE